MTSIAKILFVDDDMELQTLIPKILEHESFVVDTAGNGIECLEYLTHSIPDIIVLDVMMPKKNGWDTLKEIRISHPTLPVIMLSAKVSSDLNSVLMIISPNLSMIES